MRSVGADSAGKLAKRLGSEAVTDFAILTSWRMRCERGLQRLLAQHYHGKGGRQRCYMLDELSKGSGEKT